MMLADPRAWSRTKTVIVVDDHPIVRRGVRTLIEQATSFEIVGEADDGSGAIELAAAVNPDVVILDLSMPRLSGIEAIAGLRRLLPGIEILVFTLHRSDQLLVEALAAGARGYICKSEADYLLPALEAVARHESYVSPSLAEDLSARGDEAWERQPLTARERQVVRLVAEGNSNKGIARILKISVKTTETHRASAMRKTGSRTVTELTLYAARNRLVDL